MAKERLSNFELCRLAAILLVMLVHTTTQSLGSDVSLGIRLLKGFSIIGVNVFVLITGYFSATPKKTNLINLAFICRFWMLVKVLFRMGIGEPINFKYAFFITSSNWFIASYIGLLFFTPILNQFCCSASKRVLWGIVIALFLVEIWFDWMLPRPSVRIGAQNGYSIFSFAVLYLLARAIRIYGLPQWFAKFSPLIYLVCSLIVGLTAHAGAMTGHNISDLCYSYINPVVVISSVAFLMMFGQIKVQSGFINHIAKSTLAVLLGHSAIFPLFKKQFQYLYEQFSGTSVVAYWALSILIVFCASIAIDQIRLLLYQPIKKMLRVRIKHDELFLEQ